MKTKKFLTMLSLLALLLMLAACGGQPEPEPQAPAPTEAPAQEEEARAEEEAPAPTEAPAEEEAEAPAEADGVIKIGAALSETGKYAREGEDVRQGYDLWADWVNNEKGGIEVGDKMYSVEIIYYDDESDPDTTAKLVETLISEDEVQFLLGPYSSGLTTSASAISEKYDVIMVEGNGSSESLFERGFQNLFAVLTPASYYTQSALEMVAEKGAKTVVIAYEDTAFPTSVAEGAEFWAAEYGMEVLAVETYPKDVADVSGIMTKFRDLEPDVFVGGGHFNDALLFTRAAKELDFNPKAMIITVGPSNPQFAEEMGADADYILGPTQWEAVMSYEDDWLGTAAEYGERYEGMWGESPTYQAAESSATGLALMAAIEAAGSLETADVRQALNELDIDTFYGPISFDDTGKNVAKPMGAVQIQSGAIKVIAPGSAAEVDIAYPMPPWSERGDAAAAAPAEEETATEVAGTVKIGAALSETGKYAREGEDVRQGYDLWADWVNNEKGGIEVDGKLYQVEIIYYDDESDPDTTAKLVETLISEDEVQFLLGPYSSGLTTSASAISEKYDVIMVEGNGSSESLFERGFQNLFAVLTPASYYTQSALEMVAAKGAKTVVIAYEDTAFPTSVAEGAEFWAAEYGMEVLAVETYPKDVADVSGIMTKFRDLEPDVFVGGGHFNDALLFTRAAKELDFNPKAMIITVGPSNPQFAEEMGADANYILGPTQWEAVMSYEDDWLGTAAEYGERYEGMWGESPTYQAAESSATGLALMAAIEAANSFETPDVRQALNELDIDTFYGPISFDETGKNVAKPMGAIQIQSGDIKVIAPGSAAEVDIMYPMPAWSERDSAAAAPAEEAAEEEVAMEVAGTVKIGAALSETGKYAREGEDVRQGYDLWADWVNNEKGGIEVDGKLYQVEIIYYDDESDPDTTAKLVETLISEDEVQFLLGPYSSGLTTSASAISEKYDVIMVEGNGSSESLFERGFQNLFAVLTPASYYTQSALEMVAAKGAKTVVIAYEDTAFPTSVAEGAEFWAAEYGMDVLAVETYPKDVADVSGIMTKFRDLEPDVFVGGGHFNDALLFTRAAKELDFNPKAMIITVGPSNPQFAEEMGADANYILGPTQWEAVMSYEDDWLGTAAEYGERYEGMWGEPPTYQAAESSATGLALMAAIEAAGSFETPDVRQALNELDIDTFYGPISFDETGKNVAKPMGAIQVQEGAIKVIAPGSAAEVDIMYPMPPWSER